MGNKKKITTSLVLLLTLILSFVGLNGKTAKAEALNSFPQNWFPSLNYQYTAAGAIKEGYMCKDYGVLLTEAANNSLGINKVISDGTQFVGQTLPEYNIFLGRNAAGKLYFAAANSKSLLAFDLESGTSSKIDIALNVNAKILTGSVDKQGNLWVFYSINEDGMDIIYVARIDAGNMQNIATLKIGNIKYPAYIQFGNANDLYFYNYVQDLKTLGSAGKLHKVHYEASNNTCSIISINTAPLLGMPQNITLAKDGTFWAVDSIDRMQRKNFKIVDNSSLQLINQYSNPKSEMLAADSNGDIWSYDSVGTYPARQTSSLSKFENGTFVPKYDNVTFIVDKISIFDEYKALLFPRYYQVPKNVYSIINGGTYEAALKLKHEVEGSINSGSISKDSMDLYSTYVDNLRTSYLKTYLKDRIKAFNDGKAFDFNNVAGIDEFIKHFYQICLNRQPGQQEIDNWKNALVGRESNKIDGTNFAYQILFSPEFTNRNLSNEQYVDTLYKVLCNREADAAGKSNWVGQLNSGYNREYVFSGFIGAQEFTRFSLGYSIESDTFWKNTSNTDVNTSYNYFVYRLYKNILNREPDSAGLNNWASILANGGSAESVVNGFFNSPEFISRNVSNEVYVTILYRTMLNREPEKSGFDNWIHVLNSGSDRSGILYGFTHSQEFINMCAKSGITAY